jgi:hypothetical protein
VKKTQEALRYQFISTELDLALTFADIARPTNDEARSERNLDHAKKALRSARQLLAEATLTRSMSDDINEKMKKLKPFIDGGQPYSHQHEGEQAWCVVQTVRQVRR